MAEVESEVAAIETENADEPDTGYKAPAEASLQEILTKDSEDESLQRYKKMLLGKAAENDNLVVFPDDSRKVIVKKLTVITEGRPDQELDLSVTDKKELKNIHLALKDGVEYQVKIGFYVQHEIVAGLRYIQSIYRKGIRVSKESHMVGSYGPMSEMHSFTTKLDAAPSGMIARGSYTIKSQFTDDDKNSYLQWEWTLDIKKDWND